MHRMLALAAFAACTPVTLDNVVPSPDAGSPPPETACAVPVPALAIQVVEDVPYGLDLDQRLDVAIPATPGPHPLVVAIHGGAWVAGDKRMLRAEIERLAAAGYTAAAINYRLATEREDIFPAAVEDVRCAVRTLRAQAGQFAIDPARVAALGTSAGGHLAAMLGVAADASGFDGDCATGGSAAVGAVIAAYGVHDLAGPLIGPDALLRLFLGPYDQATLDRASPIRYVTGDDAPFLLVHGTDDRLVPVVQSHAMRDALLAAGVAASLVEVTGAGHGFSPISDDPALRTATCTALAFLRDRL